MDLCFYLVVICLKLLTMGVNKKVRWRICFGGGELRETEETGGTKRTEEYWNNGFKDFKEVKEMRMGGNELMGGGRDWWDCWDLWDGRTEWGLDVS